MGKEGYPGGAGAVASLLVVGLLLAAATAPGANVKYANAERYYTLQIPEG